MRNIRISESEYCIIRGLMVMSGLYFIRFRIDAVGFMPTEITWHTLAGVVILAWVLAMISNKPVVSLGAFVVMICIISEIVNRKYSFLDLADIYIATMCIIAAMTLTNVIFGKYINTPIKSIIVALLLIVLCLSLIHFCLQLDKGAIPYMVFSLIVLGISYQWAIDINEERYLDSASDAGVRTFINFPFGNKKGN